MESSSSRSFPIRSQPEVIDKFPFHDLRFYTMTSSEIDNESSSKIGYTAKKSLEYLNNTGRNIDLNYVPWFRPVWDRVKQF